MSENRRPVTLESLAEVIDQAADRMAGARGAADIARAQLEQALRLKSEARSEALAALGLAQVLYGANECKGLAQRLELLKAEPNDGGPQ